MLPCLVRVFCSMVCWQCMFFHYAGSDLADLISCLGITQGCLLGLLDIRIPRVVVDDDEFVEEDSIFPFPEDAVRGA